MDARDPGPLAGVRVIEIGQYVAGPMATMMLADLGADVVKVEPPGRGDGFRNFGIRHEEFAAFWLNVNRGKRSVTLDLKDPAGAERCRELAARADVILMSSRPGVLDGVGLDDATLAWINPALIRVYVTGYGTSGPRASEPVFDNLVQGLTGMAAFQGGDGDPEIIAPMIVDKTTSMLAAQATLAALHERRETGVGRRIEVSMLDVASYWNFPDMFQDRTFLADERRIGRLYPSIVPTKDGQIILSPVSGHQMRRTAEAFGHPEWVPELKAIKDHTALVKELMRRVAGEAATMTNAEALGVLKEFDVPAAPVLDLDEHFDEPQVLHNEIYETIHDPLLGDVRVVRYPAVFDGERPHVAFTAPAPGADTAAVAEDWALGWDLDEDGGPAT